MEWFSMLGAVGITVSFLILGVDALVCLASHFSPPRDEEEFDE